MTTLTPDQQARNHALAAQFGDPEDAAPYEETAPELPPLDAYRPEIEADAEDPEEDPWREEWGEEPERAPHHATAAAPPSDQAAMVEQMAARILAGDQIHTLALADPLIDGVLDLASLAALYGPPGAGKSFVALDMAMSIATGSWWFGRKVVKGTVLYIVAEGAAGARKRYDAWKKARGIHSDVQAMKFYPQAVNLADAIQTACVATLGQQLGAVLIIIDTLARSMLGAEENSSKDMGIVVANLEHIKRTTGACVLVVHHSGKDVARGLRGSNSLEGAVDTALALSASEGELTLTDERQKDRRSSRPERFRLDTIEVGTDDEGKPITSCVVAKGYRPEEALPDSALATLRALDDVDLGGGCSSSKWKAVATAAGVAETTFYRHQKSLLTLGLVEDSGEKRAKSWHLTALGRQRLIDGDDIERSHEGVGITTPDGVGNDDF